MSLVELLTVLAIAGLAFGAGALYLRPAEAPLQAGVTHLDGYFRQVRARAMATTSAYRVLAAADDRIETEYADRCSDVAWTSDGDLVLELPRGVTTTDTTWSVCFNSRGQAESNLTVTLAHAEYGSAQVEVLLGGLSRVVP